MSETSDPSIETLLTLGEKDVAGAGTGPLKATAVPIPTDCALTVPERR